MPIPLATNASTLLFRKEAFERADLSRAALDEWLTLTDEEFRVEAELIVVGPVFDVDALQALIPALEDKGLVYYDDFFEFSGNWPDWLQLHAMAARG
jgi:hypothetical protein